MIAYDDLPSVMPVMATLNAEGITTDLQASVEHLSDWGFDDGAIGVVGFCMGGSLALYTATMRPLGAVVTYYGGGVVDGRFGLPPLVDQAPALRSPWLGLYGDLDKGIPPDQVEQLRAAADIAAVDTEVVRYADADHGFNCDDRPAVFNAKAAGDAWGRMLDWFRRLGPGSAAPAYSGVDTPARPPAPRLDRRRVELVVVLGGHVALTAHGREEQPQDGERAPTGGDPHRGPQPDGRAEDSADDPAEGQDAPHDEAHGRVHPPEKPRRAQRLAEADLVDVVITCAPRRDDVADGEEGQARPPRRQRQQEAAELAERIRQQDRAPAPEPRRQP